MSQMDYDNEPRPQETPNATMVYMVSIYLLLIAFFVILHSVSRKEDVRAAAVVGSLRVTFQRPVGHTEDLPQDTGEPRFSGPNQTFSDHVIGLFGSFINSSRFSQTEGGNVLRIAVDPDEIFYAGTSSLRADRIALMRRMADLIANPQPYRRNSIGISLERGNQSHSGVGKTLAVRRAGVIARDLDKDDVDPKQISIAITEGAGGGKSGGERIFMTFTATQMAPPAPKSAIEEESAGGSNE